MQLDASPPVKSLVQDLARSKRSENASFRKAEVENKMAPGTTASVGVPAPEDIRSPVLSASLLGARAGRGPGTVSTSKNPGLVDFFLQ